MNIHVLRIQSTCITLILLCTFEEMGFSLLKSRLTPTSPSHRSAQPPPPPGLLMPNPRKDSNYQMVCINESWLTLGEELGQGEFGSVLKGKYKPPNERIVRWVLRCAACGADSLD